MLTDAAEAAARVMTKANRIFSFPMAAQKVVNTSAGTHIYKTSKEERERKSCLLMLYNLVIWYPADQTLASEAVVVNRMMEKGAG